MIRIRDAAGSDAPAIRDLFRACYGEEYPYAKFYDLPLLTRMIYSDDAVLLVAEDTDTSRLVGTASVIADVGAYSDLVGEFGRLVVHPEARHQGVGKRLMEERLHRVSDRLHVGVIEARVSHPFAQRIAEASGFSVVGLLPQKFLLGRPESLALFVRHFGKGMELRNNNPRIIPEVYPLAHLAMENCRLALDAIVDEESAPYPPGHQFDLEELTTEGYSALLRIARGRVRHREIFGPLRLHYGFFKLQSRQSNYLLAREEGRVAGAVGFTLDQAERVVRVFELISLHDEVVRFLLSELERRCGAEWGIRYIEVDVSAYAPRMQRTLMELKFLPAAYVPALVFHEVERLDVVKMVRLLTPLDPGPLALGAKAQTIADVVLRGFRSRAILPRIAQAVQHLALFAGLNEEQVHRVAGTCSLKVFEVGQPIFAEGTDEKEMYLLLSGWASIHLPHSNEPVGAVGEGECLGEMALLTGAPHSATATAHTRVETAVLAHRELTELVRLRPDIGLVVYKNLAVGIGHKLKRSGRALVAQA